MQVRVQKHGGGLFSVVLTPRDPRRRRVAVARRVRKENLKEAAAEAIAKVYAETPEGELA